MAEIDPVILQLRADVQGYLSTLRSTTDNVDKLLGVQEKRARQMEAQFKQSSSQISASLKGLAATFAGAFSVQQVGAMVDSFTRLQNSLKVAGLEGAVLAGVQERLTEIGGRYGVSVNALADLYGKNAQSAKELGATQGQLLQITEATSQALLISGTGAAQASGAILGLSQALAAGKVQAEEFNQINEGGLRPLLQAAAASTRWGGSVAKLRADVLAGKVSSQEFFTAILSGSQQLEVQASKATLTLSGAFQSLSDRLMLYVGSAAQANGATAAIAQGIQALADNLGTIINALSIVGVALVGRYAAGLTVAAAASVRASLAASALAAAQLGVAGTAGTAGVAVGRLGAAMLGAFGGPIGIAITALALGLGYLATQVDAVDDATRAKANADASATSAAEAHAAATEQLTRASQKEREALLASMQASRARAAQALQTAKAQIVEAKAALAVAKANAQKEIRSSTRTVRGAGAGLDPTITAINRADSQISPAEARLQRAESLFSKAEGALDGLDRAIADASRPVSLGAASAGSKKKTGGSSSGSSPADRQARFDEEMRRLEQEELRAKYDLAQTASGRADLEKDILAAERAARVAAVEAESDFTREQKDRQIAALNRLYGQPAQIGVDGSVISEGRPGLLAQRVNRDTEQQQNDLALSQLEAQAATLDAQADLETNTKKRSELEVKALDLHQRIERARLEEAIAAGRIAESTRDELAAQQAITRQKLSRAQRSPGEVYRDDLREQAGNINDAIEDIEVRGLKSLNDGLVEAIMGTKSLGDVFKNVANQIVADLLRIAVQRAIIEPLAGALFGGGSGSSGGGGGLLGGLIAGIGSIFGRASGGYVAPGQMVRVNEGAAPGRVEGFMSRDGGSIIPLGRMNTMSQGAGQGQGGVVTVRLDLSGDIDARIQEVSAGVAVEVVRSSAPALIDASAKTAMARAGRMRM